MHADATYAAHVMQRIDALAAVSDESGRLTRTYGSPAMRRANELVAGWMREAGMTVQTDAIGNLIGRYPGSDTGAKSLLLGSHLDTVRDAGRFDGPLGVLTAIACVQKLHDASQRQPFGIEVIAFADEEGVRFHTTYLGSRALAGTLGEAALHRKDADGVTLAEAIRAFGGDPGAIKTCRRDSAKLLGYFEVHIEQGPVLQEKDLPVGVVTAIAGQTRTEAVFHGRAAHAGTTPMALRQDALSAAARFLRDAELIATRHPGLVVTCGQIEVRPGASNVIPAFVKLSLDVRHADDAVRFAACELLEITARFVAAHRRVDLDWEIIQATRAVECCPRMTAQLTESVVAHAAKTELLPSGAGHDAAALATITPVAMLFVRCKDGISHHPDESVWEDDVRVALSVMNDFLQRLACSHA
jgi:allantoate deiminase